MTHPTIAHLARSALHARALHPITPPITLGTITLLPHQTAAVRWLQHRIARYGGALLADPPGLGKTYVALAIAAQRNTRPLVIAPAALRGRWREASEATGVPIDFVSTERLSAPTARRIATPAFVVVDEAHHLRSQTTRRHRRTAGLCAQARVLLLTATPIHNRADDLTNITALFHLPPTPESSRALRKLTLRRTVEQVHAAGMGSSAMIRMPAVTHRRPMTLPPRDGDIVSAIARIPPISEADREGHTLLQVSLLHALRSSDAACTSRVRRRVGVTLAIEHAALAHVAATPALRKAWITGDDAIQLAMPELLGDAMAITHPDTAENAARQRTALERMLPMLHGRGDAKRAVALRRLARWCERPVVAFTQFTATAESLYRRLASQHGVALLCGAEARIASGAIPRDEVLRRLLSPDRRPHTSLRLLITTDVLSEGLSLSGVATIVHLDQPWTAARLDQRVGRAARIGATVPEVRVAHLPSSLPAGADHRLRALLRRKRRVMAEFERDREDDTASLRLLQRLATGAMPGAHRSKPEWVTLHSPVMHGARRRIVAVVQLLGRRRIIAYDEGWLRAPTLADWEAIASATACHEGVSRAIRSGFRMMLQDYVDDEQLRSLLGSADDARLTVRRAADASLAHAGLEQRLALAPHITDSRRALGHLTETAKVQALVASMQAYARSQELEELAGLAVGPFDERVILYTGVVVVSE